MIDCMRTNPMRVTDWRWQRAVGYLNGTQPHPSRKQDGELGYSWIRKAANFKASLDQATTDMQLAHLAGLRPAMFWAYRIFNDGAGVELRGEIEARILANCTNWEIGYAAGTPPEVIDAYESVFFNVREKLPHRAYILHRVVGPALHRGLSEREYDLLWKLYGYLYGPQLIDALTSKCVAPVWCPSAESVSDAIQADAVGTMKLKAAIAAKTIPVNSHTQIDLLQAFTQFVEIERTTDSSSRAQDVIIGQIGAMMQAFPFNIGGSDPRNNQKEVPINPARTFDKTAVELSFTETLQISYGQELPNQRMLEQLSFPAPISQDVIEHDALAGGEV